MSEVLSANKNGFKNWFTIDEKAKKAFANKLHLNIKIKS